MRTGRPKVAVKDKRSERIPVMFKVQDCSRIEQAASEARQPVSSFIYFLFMQAFDAKFPKGKQ